MSTARALQAVPESYRNFAVPVDMDATNIGACPHSPPVPVMISRGWWHAIAAVLTGAIGRADLVISLLPVPLHGNVARLCVKVRPSAHSRLRAYHPSGCAQLRKPMVTASYVRPGSEMASLHEEAVHSGVVRDRTRAPSARARR
jgi:hypothetical protein